MLSLFCLFVAQIEIESALQAFFAGTQAKPRQKQPGRTFKMKRAQQNHLATLQDIAGQQKQMASAPQRPGPSNSNT